MPISYHPSAARLLILYHLRVDSLGVRHDSEIDWKTLSDPDWNLWSAHDLQRRWRTMKNSIRGHDNMTHAGPYLPVHIPFFSENLNVEQRSWTSSARRRLMCQNHRHVRLLPRRSRARRG